MRAWFAGLAAVLIAVVSSPVRGEDLACTYLETPQSDEGICLASTVGLASGRYALPAECMPSGPSCQAKRRCRPTQMVIMMHGHHHNSCAWRNHLREAASHGAVAVAMDYTGQSLSQTDAPSTNAGWFVQEGADDSIEAARYFLRRYPSIRKVFLFGVSMGGNSSGLAAASKRAVRLDGTTPLFDYWIAAEGVHDLTQEYLIARSLAPANASAAEVVPEIEEENGGAIESVPEAYLAKTNVLHAADMAGNGLEGAVLVHGVDDGLVPTNQSREMAIALRAVGVPVELDTVVGRGGAEDGTTLSSIALAPLFSAAGLPAYESPLAGHGGEDSDTQLVIRTALGRLFDLMAGGTLPPYRERVLPDGAGTAITLP